MDIFKFLCIHIYGPWQTINNGKSSQIKRACKKCDKIESIEMGKN
jgi:hypothetical protein